MTDFGNELFVYDEYIKSNNRNNDTKKMYNRGAIMSDDELSQLKKWADYLILNNKLTPIASGRYWRHLSHEDEDPEIIPLAIEIGNRIKKKELLQTFKKETQLNDFITIIPTNSCILKHVDVNDPKNNLFHVRFNVFITVPTDMNTYYDGQVVNAVEGSYVLCRSGIDEHWCDVNKNSMPRISLSFGYMLPAEKIDELTSDSSIGTYANYYPLSIKKLFSCLTPNTEIQKPEYRGEIGSYIFTISNVFTDFQCDFITGYINKHSSLWKEKDISYISGNNVECKFLDVTNLLSLKVLGSQELDDFIFKTVSNILKKLNEIHPDFKGTQDNGYTLRKIHGGTKLHVDGIHSKTAGFKNFVRCLSLIIVLNDDYDGGVFCFPNQGLKFRVQKGQAILFPPYWTHPHSVTSVGEGQARYTINTWILENFID